jgi:predicted  nucleic acid-binding Zn-ribbon protein
MNPTVEKLLELQQADNEIRRLTEEVSALPKRVQEIEDKLAHVKAQVEEAKAAIKADESARRRHELDIQAQQQKISKYREQSLAVKTNEQYKALMHEINFAEQEIRGLEDKILELMIDAESRQRDLGQADAEFKARTAEVEKEKNEARALTSKDQARLAELALQREALRAGIDADILRHYERVFKLRGSAIAEARDQRCMACQVLLRPQVYVDIVKGEQLITCESCHRILFYDTSRTTAPAQNPQSSPERPAIAVETAAVQ